MKEDDPYCGFLCGDIIERQQKIMQDINDFAEYNPEFAQVMRIRVLKICSDETSTHSEEKAIAITQ